MRRVAVLFSLIALVSTANFAHAVIRGVNYVNLAVDRLIEMGIMLCCGSQNLTEFWNTCARAADRNGYGLSIEEADLRTDLVFRLHLVIPIGKADCSVRSE